MNEIKSNRIQSIDLLKGLVMVIMALDHTRDYFHNGSFLIDPTDPEKTNLALFFTRWITHYCAPAFSFLAGISAWLAGRNKTTKQLSSFLLLRGAWLIFIELTIINFAWRFDIHFQSVALQVIWSLGISMIILSALIHLQPKYILLFSVAVITGHHLLAYLDLSKGILWSIIHQQGVFEILKGHSVRVIYPIIPWIGVMSLGYFLGSCYNKNIDPAGRQKLFTIIGACCIALFVIIRLLNQYGNAHHWKVYDGILPTLYSFFNPSKYPPSLTYLLMTLGPVFLFLGTAEKMKGKGVDFFVVFGRVPFFYYIIHIYMIHLLAMVLAQLTGFGWQAMILKGFVSNSPGLVGYGVDLWMVYLIWIAIVLLLYPLCKKFSVYKLNHKEKWWVSYL
ncbi:MAG TPA: heparan-alpha-glucosaminide N-acetyltransferase domain-containing protein [Agriterribacter sp.]|nr:heparan-alpha-glucosaminide N-acetyltransferase domain-containing protein [Agriterribacter sp.]